MAAAEIDRFVGLVRRAVDAQDRWLQGRAPAMTDRAFAQLIEEITGLWMSEPGLSTMPEVRELLERLDAHFVQSRAVPTAVARSVSEPRHRMGTWHKH